MYLLSFQMKYLFDKWVIPTLKLVISINRAWILYNNLHFTLLNTRSLYNINIVESQLFTYSYDDYLQNSYGEILMIYFLLILILIQSRLCFVNSNKPINYCNCVIMYFLKHCAQTTINTYIHKQNTLLLTHTFNNKHITHHNTICHYTYRNNYIPNLKFNSTLPIYNIIIITFITFKMNIISHLKLCTRNKHVITRRSGLLSNSITNQLYWFLDLHTYSSRYNAPI